MHIAECWNMHDIKKIDLRSAENILKPMASVFLILLLRWWSSDWFLLFPAPSSINMICTCAFTLFSYKNSIRNILNWIWSKIWKVAKKPTVSGESFWNHSIKKWSDITFPFILDYNIISFISFLDIFSTKKW